MAFFAGLCSMGAYCQEELAMVVAEETAPVTAEPAAKAGYDFFASEKILDITLKFDIFEFSRTKNEPEYLDATLTIKTDDQDSLSQQIKIKARGNMRRNYCSLPPIMMKFKSSDKNPATILDRGTLKLVTQCSKSSIFESYVHKEYIAYKLFNLVTTYSFKTRLVRIHYVDINKPKKSFTTYGFLIENAEDMAKRNNAVVLKSVTLQASQMNSTDLARVAVFNYMIGNTDWSVTSQHNVKILKSAEVISDKGIPVTYDYDYAGLVNTVYSAPSKDIPIMTVQERYYQGLCMSDEELKPVIEEFKELKGQFLSTISEYEYLTKSDKKWSESYISSFYKRFEYQSMLLSDLNRTCRRY
jgi:hypothetical protein